VITSSAPLVLAPIGNEPPRCTDGADDAADRLDVLVADGFVEAEPVGVAVADRAGVCAEPGADLAALVEGSGVVGVAVTAAEVTAQLGTVWSTG
jgi:hypothetical protein